MVLLEGPPGIGKSGLIAAIQTLAIEGGMQVLSASGRRRETALRWGVIIQLLESHFRGARTPPDLRPDPAFDELDGVLRILRQLAAAAPMAILIDDADLADEASLRSLLYVTERMEQLPIAVVLAFGSSGKHVPELLREVGRHQRASHTRLRPLTEGGTKRALAKRWPLILDDTAASIHRLTGGNPFLVDVVAADIAGREELRAEVSLSQAASARVADWVMSRAVAADTRSPALLRTVAVLGDECEVRYAAALADEDPEAVLDTLDRLSRVEILSPGAKMRFAHPVVADAIANVQPSGEREKLHRRAAELLADDDAPAEAIAEHLLAATRTASGWVVEVLSTAAVSALERGAPHDAVRYLRRALEEPPPRERRAELALELGRGVTNLAPVAENGDRAQQRRRLRVGRGGPRHHPLRDPSGGRIAEAHLGAQLLARGDVGSDHVDQERVSAGQAMDVRRGVVHDERPVLGERPLGAARRQRAQAAVRCARMAADLPEELRHVLPGAAECQYDRDPKLVHALHYVEQAA